MKYLLFIISLCFISCSKAQESKVSIMGVTYDDMEINVEYVEYCNDEYRYEIHFYHDEISFKLITDDVNDMHWIAVYDFFSNMVCENGLVKPYDNAMQGDMVSDGVYVDIIGEIGCECLKSDGSWKPIDAQLEIEVYGIIINGK